MSVLAGRDAEIVLETILSSTHFAGDGDQRPRWRGFVDGHWAYFESPYYGITIEDMKALEAFHVDNISAVSRSTPHPGCYLRCRLLDPRTPR